MVRTPAGMAEGGTSRGDFYYHPPPQPNLIAETGIIIHFVWDNGYIPTELGWTMLVLIPKGNLVTPMYRAHGGHVEGGGGCDIYPY